jgi:AraC-like DNA-binding protein
MHSPPDILGSREKSEVDRISNRWTIREGLAMPTFELDYLGNLPLLHTRDLSLAREVMGQHWDEHTVEIRGRTSFDTHVNHLSLGDGGLSYVRCPTPLRVVTSPVVQRYLMFLPEEGGCHFLANGRPSEASRQTASLFVPGQEMRMDSVATRTLVLELPQRKVDAALAARDRSADDLVDRAYRIERVSLPCQALESLLQWTIHRAETGRLIAPDAPQRDWTSEMLVSLVVDCLETTLMVDCPATAMIGRLRLDQLTDLIEENLRQPITLDTLATVAEVSTRSIQMAFRRHLGCTPSQFVRARRLEAAHQKLSSGLPGISVTSVANEYCFFDLGGFARAYRRQYGVSPSQTLRLAKRRTGTT